MTIGIRQQLAAVRGQLTKVSKQRDQYMRALGRSLEYAQIRAADAGDQIEFLKRALATMGKERDRLQLAVEEGARKESDFNAWMQRQSEKTMREQEIHRQEIAHWQKQVENEKTGRARDAAAHYTMNSYRPDWIPPGVHLVSIGEELPEPETRYVCDSLGIPREIMPGFPYSEYRGPLAWETTLEQGGTKAREIRTNGRTCVARLVFLP